MGPDIDSGFRISKYTERSKIVVGAKLAYLLYRNKKNIQDKHHISIEENLKIVSYESLKGVWNGRKYPIIWYDENWSNKDEMFLYDEVFNSKIISSIESDDFLKKDKYKIKRLQKIFQDLDKEKEIEFLEEVIKNSKENKPTLPEKLYSEVHCVAICFNDNNEILIAKRKSNKKICPSCWDFGCAKVKLGETFKNSMISDYKKDFNIDLSFPNNELIPIDTYEIKYETDMFVPGIIFIAIVENYSSIKSNKHETFKWLKKNEELSGLKINNFDKIIKKPIKNIKS